MTTAIAIKERPILFSGEMVRAIIEGRKTQTRRTVKPQPVAGDRIIAKHDRSGFEVGRLRDSENAWRDIACPYGKPGDRLWVREAWSVLREYDALRAPELRNMPEMACLDYKADRPKPERNGRARHARFMPRWASRITLEITDVRVERLNEISEADAIAEGCQPDEITQADIDEQIRNEGLTEASSLALAMGPGTFTAKFEYTILWDKINGDGAWAKNPWVWVLTFKRVAP